MRRLLKNFPAKGSSQNVAELKREIEVEIASIKETQKMLKAESPIPFDGIRPMQKNKSDENLLGDLLFYLRTEKLMSTLMICRQIENIEVAGGVAYLQSDSADITELVESDKHKSQLELFFKSKGLGFRLKREITEVDPIDSLKEFFGEKLIIK